MQAQNVNWHRELRDSSRQDNCFGNGKPRHSTSVYSDWSSIGRSRNGLATSRSRSTFGLLHSSLATSRVRPAPGTLHSKSAKSKPCASEADPTSCSFGTCDHTMSASSQKKKSRGLMVARICKSKTICPCGETYFETFVFTDICCFMHRRCLSAKEAPNV